MIIVVSGLPRSGTSLMMQMLRAAGVPLKTDGGDEHADEFNPGGYFEWQPMWQRLLSGDSTVVDECEGYGVKMLARLAVEAPAGHDYLVLWMTRKLEDVLASKRRARKNYDTWSVAPSKPDWTVPELRELADKAWQHWSALGARLISVPYDALLVDKPYWCRKVYDALQRPTLDRMKGLVGATTQSAVMAAAMKEAGL